MWGTIGFLILEACFICSTRFMGYFLVLTSLGLRPFLSCGYLLWFSMLRAEVLGWASQRYSASSSPWIAPAGNWTPESFRFLWKSHLQFLLKGLTKKTDSSKELVPSSFLCFQWELQSNKPLWKYFCSFHLLSGSRVLQKCWPTTTA